MSPTILVAIIGGSISGGVALGVAIMQGIAAYKTKRLELNTGERIADKKATADVAINHENKLYERVDKLEAQVTEYQRDITKYQNTTLAQERDCNRRINDLRDTIAAMAGETADNRRMLDSIGCGRADCAARMLVKGKHAVVTSAPPAKAESPP